jgi:hypothetical protein
MYARVDVTNQCACRFVVIIVELRNVTQGGKACDLYTVRILSDPCGGLPEVFFA